jgi:hypothetical protein
MYDSHPPVALEDAPEMPHEVRIYLDENATAIAMHSSQDCVANIANARPVLDDDSGALEIYSPQ